MFILQDYLYLRGSCLAYRLRGKCPVHRLTGICLFTGQQDVYLRGSCLAHRLRGECLVHRLTRALSNTWAKWNMYHLISKKQVRRVNWLSAGCRAQRGSMKYVCRAHEVNGARVHELTGMCRAYGPILVPSRE